MMNVAAAPEGRGAPSEQPLDPLRKLGTPPEIQGEKLLGSH